MLHTPPAADAAAAPAVDAVAAAGASHDVSKPFSRLSMCDRGLRDTFQSCMSKEVNAHVKEMEARLKELDRLQYDLRGFMYLSPHQKLEKPLVPEYTRYHISMPGKTHVSFYCEVKLGEDAGSWHTSLDFSFMKIDGHWKLQNEKIIQHEETRKIQITVKHAGSDEWTPVELFPVFHFHERAFDTHEPEHGTDFGHGDQINMRYVESNGRSFPVSFDGTEATNYFPLTICVIG